MKRLLLAAMASLVISAAAFAQTTPVKEKTKLKTTKPTATAQKTVAKEVVKPANGPAIVSKTTTVTTPAKEVAVTKMKANGTPDMRYKENKQAAKTTSATSPVKKDGTPDMRYKVNKKSK